MAASKQTRQQQAVKQNRQPFTDDQKARAVARVLTGDAVHKVAADLGVAPSTIRLWRAQAGGDPKTKNTDYAQVVLAHLEVAFLALDRILGQTADPVWLGKQSAGELATLYGVVFDKQARVLAAIRTGDDGAGPDQVDTGPARLAPAG